jgi:hypothetical protein
MKPASLPPRSPSAQSGSAVLVVMILLALMVALAISNSQHLRNLKHELKLTEQRQLLKFQPGLVSPTTNQLRLGWRPFPQAGSHSLTNALIPLPQRDSGK